MREDRTPAYAFSTSHAAELPEDERLTGYGRRTRIRDDEPGSTSGCSFYPLFLPSEYHCGSIDDRNVGRVVDR